MKDLVTIYDSENISDDMNTYLRDSKVIPLDVGEYLYFGLYKKFSTVYAELSVLNIIPATFSIEYYNGSTWVSATNAKDNTKGFTRSGFISWDLDLSSWSLTDVSGESLYWIRVSTDTAITALTALQGLNIVYSNDLDLQEGYYCINDLLPSNALSFISFHQSARNEIIQQLRNSGNYTTSGDLTKWDLLVPDQIREASKWKALSIIFFELSNEVDDKYDSLSKSCNEKFQLAMNLYFKSIDKNDDGVLSTSEQFEVTTTMVTRI